MILKQFYLDCLAHASYLIGDEATGAAAVVDPRRDIGPYLEEAERHGLRIGHVFLTHFHADFIAGHIELRKRTGARIHLGARARAEYDFTPMADGDAIEFGRVRLEVLETPGHTPESISILVFDHDFDAVRPYAVLTGDTLFVGDVGRPDLRASLGWSAAELGRLLFESLHSKLLTLPDDTLVYPAHGAGSLCGKNISTDAASTIGAERRSNYALRPMALQQFVATVCADQPDAPAYFTYDAVQNAREHATLDAVLARALTPLPLREVLDMQMAGTLVLDVRDGERFAAGHLPDSINVGLTGRYATWAGTVLHHEDAIAIVADPGREEEAATRLARIGFDYVVGHLEGGIATAQARPCVLVRTARVSAAQLAERLSWPLRPVVLDVRTPREWNDQHIEGSVNIPLTRLCERLSELPRNRTLVVICAGGYRSSIGASLLQRHGFDLVELAGGMQAWSAFEAATTGDRATTAR